MVQTPVIILANGNYPTHPTPVQKIKEAGSIICCDGAVNQLKDNGLEPYIIIGDLDSIDQALKSNYDNRTIYLPDQDENDLRKAMLWADKKGVVELTILGATGKRDDHSLSNIFTLLQFPTYIKCTLVTDYGYFSIAEDIAKFRSFKGQQISFFSIDPDIEITSTNLKYNLKSTKFNNIYCGSLNECFNTDFTITVSHGIVLVYQVFA